MSPRKTSSRQLLGRQAALLALIHETVAEKGRPPTYKEAAGRLKTQRSRVFHNVQRLVEMGYLRVGDPVGTMRIRLP